MPLMSDIVNDVLDELRLASGQDVQIHLQNGIRKNACRLYRTLSKDYNFGFQMSYHVIATADADGAPTTDVSSYLKAFRKINSVMLENTNQPLPYAMKSQNPLMIKRPAILPVTDPTKVFAIYPKLARTNVMLVVKDYQDEDFEMDDTIDFDRDLLAIGCAYKLSVKMDINSALTQNLEQEFTKLLQIETQAELHDIQTNLNRGNYPTEWYVDE